jgi:hypothetical protein
LKMHRIASAVHRAIAGPVQGFVAGAGVVGAGDGRGARLRAGAGTGGGGDSEFL